MKRIFTEATRFEQVTTQVHMNKRLFDQAIALHDRLNNAAYRRLVHLGASDPSDIRAASDPYVVHIDLILSRSYRRIVRRLKAMRNE